MPDTQKRLYVGGLYDGATQKAVRERFDKFGQVTSVDIRVKTDSEAKGIGFDCSRMLV